MTEEEKMAIEYFKEHIAYFKEQIKFIEAVDGDYYDEEYELYKNRVKQFETVLNLIQKLQEENKRKDKESHFIQSKLDIANAKIIELNKTIDEIQKEVREHVGFENRLKRDNREPDLFNQGRFYVANNINNILKRKLRENNENN